MKEKLQQFITLTVNRREYEIPVGNNRGDMPQSETLAHTLRDRLHLMGLKLGCGQGACGCCTVIMDGRAVTSCMVLTMDCDGSSITTIEGLADPETGDLTGLQQAFVDNCGVQCGFCTSGIIMPARARWRASWLMWRKGGVKNEPGLQGSWQGNQAYHSR